jgi:hypothetical protein
MDAFCAITTSEDCHLKFAHLFPRYVQGIASHLQPFLAVPQAPNLPQSHPQVGPYSDDPLHLFIAIMPLSLPSTSKANQIKMSSRIISLMVQWKRTIGQFGRGQASKHSDCAFYIHTGENIPNKELQRKHSDNFDIQQPSQHSQYSSTPQNSHSIIFVPRIRASFIFWAKAHRPIPGHCFEVSSQMFPGNAL